MSEVVEWLKAEIDKRQGPWMGKDFKGELIQRKQLFTAIVVMPSVAMEILALAELGAEHTAEAVGKRMMDGAAARDPKPEEKA